MGGIKASSSVRRQEVSTLADAAVMIEEETITTSPQQRKRELRPRRQKTAIMHSSSPETTPGELPSSPQLRRSNRNLKRASNRSVEDSEQSKPKPKKRKVKYTESAPVSIEVTKNTRKVRVRKPEPPVVYDIPDVERKESTFQGRLGYACLNTVLRNKRPSREAVFCSRTCRIQSIKKYGLDWVKDLGRQNMQDMLQLIEWNEQNNIRFMRISSEMFPFASHETYGYSLDYCAALLTEVGTLANTYGHRLTTHPGQFTQLGSPRENVVRASIRELEYHCQMLDLMGIGPDGVMIIHGGGVYGDKEATLQRIRKTIEDLPQRVRNRLVLENDELCYNAADLLPLCSELLIPLVFDYHHDNINPSPGLPPAAIIEQANKIFAIRGIRPKQHLSEPRVGAVSIMERRAHADRCQSLPADLPDDMGELFIGYPRNQAKDKEQAVLHLYRIYNLHPVVYDSLRPPSKIQTTETKGRKSTRRKKREIAGNPDVSDV
ncbi:UV-endonuclease UvdE-domain-containing protein [Hygrophoropsis aurantiaca]|uniref:UV-endonuclease UvdE-domain-containing protein n=1 Tax=Hygrophoropsis aurantiaca TaxID=72124 RepID=A0ACB8AJR2_9AGAM|nr:UV-endonuclease UvdE-domain-containing protein [Hygrophoropsis aurantiaca]